MKTPVVSVALLLSLLAAVRGAGGLDPAYHPPITDQPVEALALQANGEAIAGGSFTTVNGQTVSTVVRLAADGTLDSSFNNAGAGYNPAGDLIAVTCLATLSTDQVLIGGTVFLTGAQTVQRVSAGGVPDSSFVCTADGQIVTLAVAPHDTVYVGGQFTKIDGAAQVGGVARLTASGAADPTFNPPTSYAGQDLSFNLISSIIVEPAGTLVVAGEFNLNGRNGAGAIRLGTDGSADGTLFTFSENSSIAAAAADYTGQIVVAGLFTSIGGAAETNLARLKATGGTADPGFTPDPAVTSPLNATQIVTSPDGQVFVAAYGANPVLDFTATGALNPDFQDGLNASGNQAHTILRQADGNLLVGGTFTVNGASETGVARLLTGTTTKPSLSPTTFLVNGTNAPSDAIPGPAKNVAVGTPFAFTATQGSSAAGLSVRVQATTTPTVEASWTDLPDAANGAPGRLHNDGGGNFSLTTAQVPTGPAIYFRAISAAPGYNDSTFPGYIGPFDISISAPTPTPTPVPVPAAKVDLHVTQTALDGTLANPASALIGDQITYRFSVINNGPDTAKGVTVTNVFGGTLRFVSADNSFVTSNLSTDPVAGGGTVTWRIGDLPPNPGEPIILQLTVKITSLAAINSSLQNNNFAVNATGVPGVQGGPDFPTIRVTTPLDVSVTSNGMAISPGGLLIYTFTVTNNAATALTSVVLDLPLGLDQTMATAVITNKKGVAATDQTPVKVNSTDILYAVGDLGPGQKVYLQVTLPIPYDADPTKPISLAVATLKSKTAGGAKSVNSVAIAPAALSGKPPVNPPHFTLFKFVPDGLSILQLIGENAEALSYFTQIFPSISTESGINDLGKTINPDVLEITDDNGNSRQCVFASDSSGVSHLTYGLIFSNDGGYLASDTVLTDRIPPGTKLDASQVPTLNGAPFAPGAMTVEPDGRTIHFAIGKVKPDKFNTDGSLKKPSLQIVLYTVDVLKPNKGGPSLGAAVQAQGGSLTTSSLSRTAYAVPSELDTATVARGAAYLESYKGTPVAPIHGNIYYDLFYQNTGGLIPQDFQIVDTVPTGTSFVSAEFLDGNHLHRDANGAKGEFIDPVTNGAVRYHLGPLKPTKSGWVRLTVRVEESAVGLKDLVIENAATVPGEVFPENSRARLSQPDPRDLGNGSLLPPLATGSSLSPVALNPTDPLLSQLTTARALPRLSVGLVAPLSVQEGVPFDCMAFVANTTDAAVFGSGLEVFLPKTVQFVSANQDNALVGPGLVDTEQSIEFPNVNAAGTVYYNLSPHTALIRKFTLVAPPGTAGTAITISRAHTGPTIAVQLQIRGVDTVTIAGASSGPTSTYVYAAGTPFSSVSSQIVASALALTGSSPSALGSDTLKQRVAALTPTTQGSSVGGADVIALNNGVNIIPMGSPAAGMPGNVLVFGAAANVVSNDGGSIVAQGGGNIVAQGGGNVISNDGGSIVAQGGGNLIKVISNDGGSIVAQGGGNVQAIIAGIVAQGGGNIVAQGGGNILNVGGLNLISQDGFGVISNDGGSITPLNAGLASSVVAAGQGALIGDDGSSIVAQGGGNIVAQGGGNIVAQGGGNVINAGGGVASANGLLKMSADGALGASLSTGGLISAAGGNVINTNGSNIVAQGGGN